MIFVAVHIPIFHGLHKEGFKGKKGCLADVDIWVGSLESIVEGSLSKIIENRRVRKGGLRQTF
jgi:hypothetical protein